MTKQNNIQLEKGNLLNTLHHNGKLLELPNIWDPLGAILLESWVMQLWLLQVPPLLRLISVDL